MKKEFNNFDLIDKLGNTKIKEYEKIYKERIIRRQLKIHNLIKILIEYSNDNNQIRVLKKIQNAY